MSHQAITLAGPDASVMLQGDTHVTVERDLVSQAEEEDMEALLGRYTSIHNLL